MLNMDGVVCGPLHRSDLFILLTGKCFLSLKDLGRLMTVSEVGLELLSSLKSGFLWALHLHSTV